MPVEVTTERDVAVVTLANPPVNAISPWVPLAVMDALRAQEARPEIRAVVLRGAGRCFSAGADIAAFDAPRGDGPNLRDLLAVMDSMTKPLVAAVHGLAYGGGLEIALAAHWRVASPEAKFALPEIHLGLLPGAGGTQRLPRLVGAGPALAFMMDGKPIDAAAAKAAGLVDLLAEGDLTESAVAFARDAAVRRVRDIPLAPDPGAIAAARAAAARRPLRAAALSAIVEHVEAAPIADFDAQCAAEHRSFDRLLLSDASRAMRYAFGAERLVAKVPGLPTPAPLSRAAVIGAGTMGTGIALALLNADMPVVLVEPRPDALARSVETIRANFAAAVKRGRMDAAQAEERMERLWPESEFAAVADADIVIEAVFEDMDVKRDVFTRLDAVARPGAILASNTSTLDVDRIAAFTTRPEQVVGTHFFSPANIMRLLEVVRGARTSPAVLASVMGLAKRLGKVGVVSGVCDGFIGNRMFEEYLRQAYALLEEGALPAQVDGAMERWGFALGPLRVMDLAGNDIGWSIRKRRAVEQPDRPYSRIPDLVCELGRFGQKTKAGWYLYPDGRKAVDDPDIESLVVRHSAELQIERRPVADSEIVDRCLLALVNEGAKLLGEGIAARPLDVDQVWVQGYGFPVERGGPMFAADRIGLPEVLRRIEGYAAGRGGWAWTPAPLLVDLVSSGRSFAGLNG